MNNGRWCWIAQNGRAMATHCCTQWSWAICSACQALPRALQAFTKFWSEYSSEQCSALSKASTFPLILTCETVMSTAQSITLCKGQCSVQYWQQWTAITRNWSIAEHCPETFPRTIAWPLHEHWATIIQHWGNRIVQGSWLVVSWWNFLLCGWMCTSYWHTRSME